MKSTTIHPIGTLTLKKRLSQNIQNEYHACEIKAITFRYLMAGL